MHDWGDEQGILVGLDNLDAVVQVIRNAKDGTEASLVLQQGIVLPINYQIYPILWWHRIEKVLRSLSS
jgi:DNA gyrase/topoisomerase IV subunit A